MKGKPPDFAAFSYYGSHDFFKMYADMGVYFLPLATNGGIFARVLLHFLIVVALIYRNSLSMLVDFLKICVDMEINVLLLEVSEGPIA